MKAVVQFVIRQSGIMAFLCLAYAFLQAFRVGEGLWQGAGLHGYAIEQGKAHMGLVVSVWASFLNMLAALGLAIPLGLAALWHGSTKQKTGNAGVVENPGRENVLRTKRRQRKTAQRR